MQLNPNNSEITAAPAHLASRIKVLQSDLEALPLDAAPAAVSKAHAAFVAAVAWARQVAAQVAEAELAADEARKADIAAAVKIAGASGAPKLPEATRSHKAAGAVEAALLNCEAAEKHVENALALVHAAVRGAWPEWRRDDVARAEQAHGDLEAALAAALAAAQVVVARRAGVVALDHEVLAHAPALKAQVSAERRPNAVAWYAETHLGGRGLDGVVQSIGDIAAQAAASREFAAASWLPPDDPGHSELLSTPVDAGSEWLRRMAQRETTSTCSVCNREPAAVPMVIEGKWWTVCPACAKANAPEQDKILSENARQAKVREHGVDPNASFSIGEDGDHHPA